jgi:hypothetical protein
MKRKRGTIRSMRTSLVLICSFVVLCAASGGNTTTTDTTTSQHNATKTSQHVVTKAPQHVPTKAPQQVATHNNPPAVSNAHVQHAQVHPPNAGGHPPTARAVTGPAGPETHPKTAPGVSAAAKPAASAQSAPVYHYNFRTKSGLIGRDFSRPLTSNEQSAIARQLENGPPKGTRRATDGYDSEEGVYHYNFRTKSGLIGRDFTKPLTAEEQSAISREMEKGQPQATQVRSSVASTQAKANAFRPQHFSLPSKSHPAIAGVKFEGTGHIPGSETWTDPKYAAFHDYHHEWHDKNWWEHHPNPIHCSNPQFRRPMPPTPHRVTVLVYGGWYRWYGGYWYPAWGYDVQNNYYPYDGPIYAYDGLAPDQVIANVQAALQELGYYYGPINGFLDSATRAAIANYQQDHGLYATSAIDEPTLAALGIT